MLNKAILLACLGRIPNELIARLKITVGETSNLSNRGYSGIIGSCEVLEGSLQITDETGSNFLSGIVDESAGIVSILQTDIAKIRVDNETTGYSQYSSASGGSYSKMYYQLPYGIFEGVEAGQECVIAIYA